MHPTFFHNQLSTSPKFCIFFLQNEFPSELELQMEIERLVVKEFAVDQLQQMLAAKNHQSVQQAMPPPSQANNRGPTTTRLSLRTSRGPAKKPPKAK